MNFFERFFSKGSKSSKDVAKERLKLVLVQDKTNISTKNLEKIKNEIIAVLSKYVDIDEQAMEISLSRMEDRSVALVANIPVINSKARNRSLS